MDLKKKGLNILMYQHQKEGFAAQFGCKPQFIFSAPGRTEISGNHTDHQHGCVMAAAVNREALAAVAENGTMTVRLYSEGYGLLEIDLNDMTVHPEEVNTTASLIRGVASKFQEYGLLGLRCLRDLHRAFRQRSEQLRGL